MVFVCINYLFPSFPFQPVCVLGSKVSLPGSMKLKQKVSTVFCHYALWLESFIDLHLQYLRVRSFCRFALCCIYALQLFCPSFPAFLSSFIFGCFFGSEVFKSLLIFFCAYSMGVFFTVTIKVTYNILKLQIHTSMNLHQLNFTHQQTCFLYRSVPTSFSSWCHWLHFYAPKHKLIILLNTLVSLIM